MHESEYGWDRLVPRVTSNRIVMYEHHHPNEQTLNPVVIFPPPSQVSIRPMLELVYRRGMQITPRSSQS